MEEGKETQTMKKIFEKQHHQHDDGTHARGKNGKMEDARDGRRCQLVDGTGLSWSVGSLMERILLPVVIVVVIISIIFNKRVNAWEHHCPIPSTLHRFPHSPSLCPVAAGNSQAAANGRRAVARIRESEPKTKRSRPEPDEARFFK